MSDLARFAETFADLTDDDITQQAWGVTIWLVPLRRRGLDAAALLARWRHLPPVDAGRSRSDLDDGLDPSL